MKKLISLFLVLIILLCGCSQGDSQDEAITFTQRDDGVLVSSSGVEYELVCVEGVPLRYLGELTFIGDVQGELPYKGYNNLMKTGVFALEHDENNDFVIRIKEGNEWYLIYRKSSLPPFDFSLDNCSRLELVGDYNIFPSSNHAPHLTCNQGITNAADIAACLSDIRSQESTNDGSFDHCGVIYAYFDEAPTLAIRMDVHQYSEEMYTVMIDNKEYVLPQTWADRLTGH